MTNSLSQALLSVRVMIVPWDLILGNHEEILKEALGDSRSYAVRTQEEFKS